MLKSNSKEFFIGSIDKEKEEAHLNLALRSQFDYFAIIDFIDNISFIFDDYIKCQDLNKSNSTRSKTSSSTNSM